MLVSILIPCYNAERWVGHAIESALAQTWVEKEVIVVDDGSSDGSLAVIKRFGDRIRWETGPNRGGNGTRNRLTQLALGDWLQFLDADDYLRPEKVERQIRAIKNNPDSDVIFGAVAWERVENGKLVCTDTAIEESEDPWILLALWKLPQTGGSIWRRDSLLRVGGWREGLRCCQEHELYFRMLARNAKFVQSEGCLAVWRDLDIDARVTRSTRSETLHQRVDILDSMENHLRSQGSLTAARRQAINDARHAIARTWWPINDALAKHLVVRIKRSDPRFQPRAGPASPLLYRIACRMFGVVAAQKLAAWRRKAISRR